MSDTSPNQIAEINRANARHSTGPRTGAGKQRASLNALRHGLTGQTVVLPSDDLIAYQRHCQELHGHYRPKNKMEVQLTQTLADLTWRLNRITAIETNLLALGITENSSSIDTGHDQTHTALVMAKVFDQQIRTLANISLYERRLSSRFKETLKQLTEMQAARQARESSDMYDAAKILQMQKHKGLPYNPADDGFVFSEPDIQAYIRRRDRRDQAYAATG